jgi:hypothetical protein
MRRDKYGGVFLAWSKAAPLQTTPRTPRTLFVFSAKLRQAAQDPESKGPIEGRYSDPDSMNKPIKENWTAGDISGFGFALTLVLLATILSAYSDNPAFWLLVGTGPIVIGVTLIAFLRHLFSLRRGLTAQGQNLRAVGLGWLGFLYRNAAAKISIQGDRYPEELERMTYK